MIIKFLEENEQSNVVFLGAGLETSYNRINNKTAKFSILIPPFILLFFSLFYYNLILFFKHNFNKLTTIWDDMLGVFLLKVL